MKITIPDSLIREITDVIDGGLDLPETPAEWAEHVEELLRRDFDLIY
jgi:hypothetical protein